MHVPLVLTGTAKLALLVLTVLFGILRSELVVANLAMSSSTELVQRFPLVFQAKLLT